MKRYARIATVAAAVLLPLGLPAAQDTVLTPMTPDIAPAYDAVLPAAEFVRRDVLVPMRDGVKLFTVIIMKKGARKAPILLSRTPYNANGAVTRTKSLRLTDVLPVMDAEFVEDGSIRVYQDLRGLHRSEGQFVMNRPLAGPLNPTGIDESTDAYDTIDWLVKNVPEGNGRVGVIGSSYLGFTTLMAEINPHPALKAAAPQSPMVDGWMGDDWFHNGAFRMNSFDFALRQSTGKADAGAAIPHGPGDDYTRYLAAGSAGAYAEKYAITAVPFVRKLIDNPAYTEFWSLQAVDKWMATRPLTVPTMLEVGQWDQEDSYGAPAVYRALRGSPGAAGKLTLVIGPWRHSGANHYGSVLGGLSFTGDTALEWRRKWLKPFFDHHLKGAPDPQLPAAVTYATGVNQWESSSVWPVGKATAFYLDAGRRAGFAAPVAAGSVSYVSDPSSPVPFVPRPVHLDDADQWQSWLVRDQRFVDGRPDVITFVGEPLDHPVHIMGEPGVDLFIATTGTDADVVAKLIDIYPDAAPERGGTDMSGYQLGIGIEIFRGRYLDSFAVPKPLKPGVVNRFRFNLPNVNHVFLPGHRIAVQVQSSLFPLYDRNPQTFVQNIFHARDEDYRPATMSIWYGGVRPSAVWLPITP